MRVAVLLAVMASATLSTAALAKSGSEVLDDVRDDARREAESSVRGEIYKSFPYSGSLYGLPGQTRSDSIRESAIRAALGGMFGSCKKAGTIDLGKIPTGLGLDVGPILANTEIVVPNIKAPSGGNILSNVGGLIPKPTEVASGQVKVGGSWIPTKDYQQMVAETQAGLQQAATTQAAQAANQVTTQAVKDAPKPVQQAAKKTPVSQVWAKKPPATN